MKHASGGLSTQPRQNYYCSEQRGKKQADGANLLEIKEIQGPEKNNPPW